MPSGLMILFLFAGALFAAVHYVAVLASLYWFFWWFDIMMHFWGGLLIGLGVHALARYSWWPFRPTWIVMILVLAVITGVWEVFEFGVGLYNPATHFMDTLQDVLIGFSGGLLSHFLLKTYTMRKL